MSSSAIRTSLLVRRWDPDQTEWVLRRISPNLVGLARTGKNVTVQPATFRAHNVEPCSVTLDEDCNLVTQAGWVSILGGVAGTSIVNKFSGTYGRIGVGTSTTTASYSDTKLGGDTGGGSTTSWYQACGAAPTLVTASTPPTMAFTATFGTSAANFAWNEFGVDNYNTSGVTIQGLSNVILLDHGVSSQGTKSSGSTWTATVTFNCGFPSGAGTVS